MLVESYLLPPSPKYPLSISAKRYWVEEFEQNAANPEARTLILLHSTSFHKETWEPTLEDLFNFALKCRDNAPIIREAWAIDCPNHGESGQRNAHILKQPDCQNFSCDKYAQAAHRFLSAGLDQGACVDFHSRKLVGIGHSLGANTMLILQDIQPVFSFSTLVIIEPMVSAAGRKVLIPLRDKLVARARKRAKHWATREEARKDYMVASRRGSKWDPRVLDLFLEYGLYWSEEQKCFELSCTPEQEATMYLDKDGPITPVLHLNRVCNRVHLILGCIHDFIPEEVQKALVDPKSGRQFASVTHMQTAGHLIPQETPREVAELIFKILSKPSVPSMRSSRL